MRRNLKWLSLGLAVLCVVAMAVSREWLFRLNVTDRVIVQLHSGQVTIMYIRTHTAPVVPVLVKRFFVSRLRTTTNLRFAYSRAQSHHRLAVPLWAPAAVFVLAFGLLHRLDRRPKPGHCGSCGYNLTGNLSGVCPECGQTG